MVTSFDELKLKNHLDDVVREPGIQKLRNSFARDGFLKIRNVVTEELREAVRREVFRLIDAQLERRDLYLATTDNSPRHMSVVRSEFIAQESRLIVELSKSAVLLDTLSRIADVKIIPSVSEDEEYLITKQERKGDTHGWHWGDYSFALIWIIETPTLSKGGMLQCVPHTYWDKSNARINEILCDNPISTYGFESGDIYLLRTDTTLHRTVPLAEDSTRIILNMTWSDEHTAGRALVGNDRWWENANVEAARQTA
jgi:L-lysine 4-chlorinase